jgi:hypothetical protein
MARSFYKTNPNSGKAKMKTVLAALVVSLAALTAQAADGPDHAHSKYAGQETRTIKSLSPGDIAELRRGGGWGLAKAAELNGMPGPAHLLELKDTIALDAAQVSAINSVYAGMKSRAIELGEKLIGLERDLEGQFRNRTVSDATLRASLGAIAETRKELRYTHLAAHLETPKILSEDQIKAYNAKRGYANPDPCANIPTGHDAAQWRKHNGCK